MNSVKVDKVVNTLKSLPIPRKWPISVVSGIFVIIIFWSFAIISMLFFPKTYNPFVNWVSDLGSHSKNPRGSVFFNIGCIISGIAMFPFFAGLYEWYIGGRRNKILTILTQVAGFYTALAMIMIGLFPEDYLEIHIFWSMSLFTITVLTFFLPSYALYKFKFTRNIAMFGFIATIINLILWFCIIPIMEWITIFICFLFIGAIIQSMQKRIERLRFVRHQHIELPKKRKKKKRK
ncbi:MAG: DUF998 domain-containing protein [Candidatus Hodarchaeota archaeon]